MKDILHYFSGITANPFKEPLHLQSARPVEGVPGRALGGPQQAGPDAGAPGTPLGS